MKKSILVLICLVLVLGIVAVSATISATPSTNAINIVNGWAHVEQTGIAPGEVTLEFTQPRNFWACFEYRTDGDTSQVIAENGGVNYNTLVADGLYPYYCERSGSESATIEADEYVEVRMVFGAEGDERFDWTRFDVGPENEVPEFTLIGALVGLMAVAGIFILMRKR